MDIRLDTDKIYRPSEDVVARDLHGEFIIIPITAGIGDLEDELFTINEIGKAIWDKLDGKKNLKDIAKELTEEFEAPYKDIEKDVSGFMEELLKRRIVIEV